eukprot:Phypoly_transcript_04020.p1 GENE.Phypoly_transcript_04020~~Phypoly_transcript_04020.p1  ORF type:complete len:697 (+),score=86.98 Phypoly_transcript_04020:161-2251(+)
MSTPAEEIEEEYQTQALVDETVPPSPPVARSPPRQFIPDHPATNGTDSPSPSIYTNAITISIPTFSLPYFIYLWDTFLANVRIRVAPLFLRRSIVFYCVLFLMLQLLLMMFYQHRANTLGNGEFRRGRRVEPDFEAFVNQRKDRTNTTTVLFVDKQNREWVHNFMHDLRHMQMANYIIFAKDSQLCTTVDRQGCYVLSTADHHSTMKSYKYAVWQALLEAGVHVLSVDPDVVFLDNPILYFDHTVDLNIMLEYPAAITSKWTSELEQAGLCCTGRETFYNAGFFYLKSSSASLRLLDEMRAKDSVGIQEAINLSILRVPTLKVRGLDRDMFSNGFVGFLESSPTRKRFDTIVYKLNWAEPIGKLNRARELLHWHLDPIERYSQPRKYLTYSTEDDFISLQVEHDYLALAYYIAKVLGRSLILPKFHCYVGEPATCNLDALFDPAMTESLDVFEHSFLRNPQVPHENLRRKKLALRRFNSIAELVDYLDKIKTMPLIDLTLPRIEEDGSHLSLEMLEDRASSDELSEILSNVERTVHLNTNGLFATKFTNEVQQQLNKEPFTCVVTCPYKLANLLQRVKTANNKLVYMVTNEPTLPTHKDARKFLDTKLRSKLILGHESAWVGHQLLAHHSAPTHLQMAACAQADHVIINSWEPAWLIGGICDMRRMFGNKGECEFMQQDPWLPEPWKSVTKRNITV